MTTKGIEDQYAAYDEELNEELDDEGIIDDINRVCSKVADAINEEDIHVAMAAMCTLIVDTAHQLDVPETERAFIINSALSAAWKDYHDTPPRNELH